MKHILLLEDDADVSSLLIRLLEEEKYYVSATARVADACEILERVKVDLFITDVLLPDGTAFPALDTAQRRGVPYLLMTGSVEHMGQMTANGEFHLSKPFRLGTFINEIRDRIGPGDSAN
jgi:two-component system OmpR family response regulator